MKKFIFKKGKKQMKWTYYDYCNLLESDKGDKIKIYPENLQSCIDTTVKNGGWNVEIINN